MTLDVSNNSINFIPETYFVGCEKLRYVFLGQNQLSDLPDFTPLSLTLLELNLANNHIKSFGSLIGTFIVLNKLIMSFNELSDISEVSNSTIF